MLPSRAMLPVDTEAAAETEAEETGLHHDAGQQQRIARLSLVASALLLVTALAAAASRASKARPLPKIQGAGSEELSSLTGLYGVVEGEPAPPECTVNKTADSGYNVAVVFSGRRNRMSLLVQYMDRLVQECKLHEVHLWDYTRNEEDAAWLREISSHPGYKLMTDIPKSKKPDWGFVYRYYTSSEGGDEPRFEPSWPGATRESTVLMKIDDDIIYVDHYHFADFTRYVRTNPHKFLVHANVVNNGVAAYYQAKHFPKLAEEFPKLEKYPYEKLTPGLMGPLLRDSYISSNLLWMFLAHKDEFHWEDPDHDDCIDFEMPDGQLPRGWIQPKGQGRFSVNCFGVRWANWDKVSELVKKYNFDDEHALTTMATQDPKLQECMFTPFNVVHYSFGKQTHPEDLMDQFGALLQEELGKQDKCENKEGQSNIVLCECGDAMCLPGQLCFAASSTCEEPACENTEGQRNGKQCKCGTETCDENDFCTAAESKCEGCGLARDSNIGVTGAETWEVVSADVGWEACCRICRAKINPQDGVTPCAAWVYVRSSGRCYQKYNTLGIEIEFEASSTTDAGVIALPEPKPAP